MNKRLTVLLAAGAAVAAIAVGTACEPVIAPPPIPPPVVSIFKEIFHSTVPDPTGVHAPREPHSCAVLLEPADSTLHAPYTTVDAYWNANGWSFWVACVQQARALGRSLPVVKITGDENNPTLVPFFPFHFDTAPVFGRGSGHYSNLSASNPSIWRRAYLEASG